MVNTLRYNTMTFHDLTVVMVPKQFYNSRIFVNSFFLRGPGWNANFIPKGSLVQVALHHELVSCSPQESTTSLCRAPRRSFARRSKRAGTRSAINRSQ